MKEVTTAFRAMQTDIQISMDDVVSAFVSQYENNLYERKKELTAAIKAGEEQSKEFHASVREKLSGDSFIVALPYDLIATVSEGVFNWKEEQIDFIVEIKPKEPSRYNNSITVKKSKPLTAKMLKTHAKLTLELNELRAALSEVLVSLKSVARKERQVRGRIAVRKLEDSGYSNLLEDSELAKLVQLDD